MQSLLKTVMSLRLTLILQSGFSTAFFHRNDNEKLCFCGMKITGLFFVFTFKQIAVFEVIALTINVLKKQDSLG